MTSFYFSFADNERGGFLGGVFCDAENVSIAIEQVNAAGLNPGGEVMIVACPEGLESEPRAPRMKLLSKAEMIAIGAKSISEAKAEGLELPETITICRDCNDAN